MSAVATALRKHISVTTVFHQLHPKNCDLFFLSLRDFSVGFHPS